jgi:hypothetical protein
MYLYDYKLFVSFYDFVMSHDTKNEQVLFFNNPAKECSNGQ